MLRRFLFATALFLITTNQATAEIVDRVVAVVNEDAITLTELNREGEQYLRQVAAKTPAEKREAVLAKARQEVLSGLIDKTIALQKAAEMHITVSPEEVEAAITRILASNNRTVEDFRRDLVAMGITENQYRDSLRDQILKTKLINYEVRSKVVVIEDRIREYYDQNYTKEVTAGGYYILQMGFSWVGSPDQTEQELKFSARSKAEAVRAQALEGENFRELAKQFSELPSAADGGDIGVLRKDEMAPYMREIIVPMKPGEVSPIVETDSGYQFFKLLSVKEGDIITQAPYDSVKEEIRDKLYQQEMDLQYKKWVTDLRAGAYIKELL